MSKFIEIQAVEQLIKDDVQDSIAVHFMVYPDTKGTHKGAFGIYYDGLYDGSHCTDTAQETGETVIVIEGTSRGFIESHEFDLYTSNDKKYISRKEYDDVFPPEL